VTNNHDNDTDNDDKILFQADKGFIGIFILFLFEFYFILALFVPRLDSVQTKRYFSKV